MGYGWLCEVGNGSDSSSILASRAMSLLYGMGAALTLDEFALWLNLKDVYFVREGTSSIDAVVLFGSLLAISAWGAPLLSDRTTGKFGRFGPAYRLVDRPDDNGQKIVEIVTPPVS